MPRFHRQIAVGLLVGVCLLPTPVAVGGKNFSNPIPSFIDCTSESHGDWARFRVLHFGAHADASGIPAVSSELTQEAARLFQKWHWKLAVGNEDFSLGAADFYHSCHWGEASEYCLYGHVAVLAYIARHLAGADRGLMAQNALRLLGWSRCLDFIESSSWGVSTVELLDMAGGHAYPRVQKLHQFLEFGPGTDMRAPQVRGSEHHTEDAGVGSDGKLNFWIFEFGTHRALSNEPVSMMRRALPDYNVIHQNFVKPYEGRAEISGHPYPRECSPNCQYQQETAPYTFPVFDEIDESRRGFEDFFNNQYMSKPEVRRASALLCTNPVFYCSLFAGLNKTVIGYFGLPLLYMVPQAAWRSWIPEFLNLASIHLYVANNALLAEQIAWQSGARLPVVQPVVLYVDVTYTPSRANDVLVPEPRESCTLYCVLRSFVPDDYPFRFFTKADTDRSLKAFATFRSVVIFPHDVALMSFYEFYAMAVPLFLPSDPSRLIFPYSASVPLLDWVPDWAKKLPGRPPHSPLSLTSRAALELWSPLMDFFAFPGVEHFSGFADLLERLPRADLGAMSATMRRAHAKRLVDATAFWHAAAVRAVSGPSSS